MTRIRGAAAATLGGSLQAYLLPVCIDILDLRTPLTARRVHRSRKALRRLRSVLRVFDDAFDPAAAAALADDASWISGLLGPVRDADVLRQRFDGTDVVDAIVAQRRHDSTRARQALESERYRLFRLQIARWAQQPPFTALAEAPADTMVDFVDEAHRVEQKRIRRALRASATDETLHRARKAARRHRYAGEAAHQVLGRTRRRRIKLSRNVQEILGEHQDLVVATRFLLRTGQVADTPRHLTGLSALTRDNTA